LYGITRKKISNRLKDAGLLWDHWAVPHLSPRGEFDAED
jgi:hypothetical protein